MIAPPGGQFENAVGAIAPKFLSHDQSTNLKRSTSVYAMLVIAPPKFMSLSLLNQPVSLSPLLPPSLSLSLSLSPLSLSPLSLSLKLLSLSLSLSQIDTVSGTVWEPLSSKKKFLGKQVWVSGAGSIQGTHSKFLGTRNFLVMGAALWWHTTRRAVQAQLAPHSYCYSPYLLFYSS